MDKGIDGMGYWIAAPGLQLCLQMAGIGEADGGIGDRALPSFRADLFLDDVRVWSSNSYEIWNWISENW